MEREREFKVGDKVCWARSFTSQIADYTSATASRRGTVTAVGEKMDIVRVRWDDGPEHWSKSVNLWDATRIHLEPR